MQRKYYKVASENENTHWLTSILTKKKILFVPKNMKNFKVYHK